METMTGAGGTDLDGSLNSLEDCNNLDNCIEVAAYRKMHSAMFNAITDALEKIQDISTALCKAQQISEQIYIETGEISAAMDDGSSE